MRLQSLRSIVGNLSAIVLRISMCAFSRLPSSIKVLTLRLRGAKVGHHVHVGWKSIINSQKINIGNHVAIGENVVIEVNELYIEERVKIGDHSRINGLNSLKVAEYTTIMEGFEAISFHSDSGDLTIGQNCWIGERTMINVRRNVKIGNNVCLARECQLWTHGYFAQEVDGYPINFGEIVIEDDVWISPRTIILPGVMICKGAVIGTGAVVSKDVQTSGFFAGVPAKKVRSEEQFRKELSQKEKVHIVYSCLQNNLSGLGYHVVSKAGCLEVKGILKDLKIFFLEDDKDIDVNTISGPGETIFFLFSKAADDMLRAITQRPNATYFDTISRKYFKKQLESEILLKTILNERTVRFTRIEP